LVSVVIPVYNGARFIADAIHSVLTQTYRNVECIVVDDGSQDDTARVVETFGNSVRYLWKANGGVSSARNFGAKSAHGEYIALLDADDLWVPHKLERQLDLVRTAPDLGLVYTGVKLVDEHLEPLGVMKCPHPSVALRNTLLMELPVVAVSMTALIPATVFFEVGGFDERLSTSADTDFACRVARRYPVGGIDEPLALYRQHQAQMHLNARAMEMDMLVVLEKFFADSTLPSAVRSLRRRAYANLHATLVTAYLAAGEYPRVAHHLTRGMARDPFRTIVALSRPVRRRLPKLARLRTESPP